MIETYKIITGKEQVDHEKFFKIIPDRRGRHTKKIYTAKLKVYAAHYQGYIGIYNILNMVYRYMQYIVEDMKAYTEQT